MKNLIISLLALLVMFANTTSAQDSTPPTGLTPEQVELLRNNIKGMSELMGVKDGQPVKPQTSMAEVADKALDVFTGAISKIAGSVEKIAPKFWAIMIRQQYAKAVAAVILPLAWVLAAIIVHFLLRKFIGVPAKEGRWTEYNSFLLAVTVVVPVFAGTVSFLVFFYEMAKSVSYLINPEYYAVRDILIMFSSPGSL